MTGRTKKRAFAVTMGLALAVLGAWRCGGESVATEEPAPAEKAFPGLRGYLGYSSFCSCNWTLYVCATGSCLCGNNGAYCRAGGTSQGNTDQNDDLGSYPNCANGAASDPDGDGWGWENNKSCRVVSGSGGNYPNCGPNAIDPDNDGWGWENNQSCRMVSSGGSGSGGGGSGSGGDGRSTSITGRISMGTRDGNQCGIRYTGNERVGSSLMLITGIDTPTFGVWQNGIPSALCGRIAKVYKNGQTYPFVVADRIWENTSYAQLDVAKEFFYSVMGNDNWTANVEITSQVAPGLTCDSWVFQHAVSKSYCTNR